MKRINMENKKFELNDAQLDDVSGGFLDVLFGYSKEPTPAATERGLTAGLIFDTRRSCIGCGETHYRVKDFHKDDRKVRVVCSGCGSPGYWDYEIFDTWKV